MESQRSFILIGLALVSFLLWQEWQNAYSPQPVVSAEQQIKLPSNAVASVAGPQPLGQDVPVGADVPKELQTQASALPTEAATQTQNNRYINVITDTLSLQIDRIGGDVVKADLLKYPVEQDSEESYSLLRPTVDGLYVAQSGLIGANGPDANPEGRPYIHVQATKFVLEGETLRVPLTWVGVMMASVLPRGLSLLATVMQSR